MNYRHGYHAGNFADVFKHLLLMSLIDALKRKDKPLCYLETHAGAGLYDLASPVARKTSEYTRGVLRVFEQKECPPIVEAYRAIIIAQGFPSYYPGSPLIVRACLRPTDRMVVLELHPEEYGHLRQALQCSVDDKTLIAAHHQDGYAGIKAFLPPKERRGLVFIDPPFEQDKEWMQILSGVELGVRRFQTGTFAVWYPIKNKKEVQDFLQKLKERHLGQLMVVELSIYPEDARLGLVGCGLVVVNPPWQWAFGVESWLPWLWNVLSVQGRGSFGIQVF